MKEPMIGAANTDETCPSCGNATKNEIGNCYTCGEPYAKTPTPDEAAPEIPEIPESAPSPKRKSR